MNIRQYLGISFIAVSLAITSNWWLTKLLEFIGTNSNLMGGIAAFIQLCLWGCAISLFVYKAIDGRGEISRRRQNRRGERVSKESNENSITGNLKENSFNNNINSVHGLVQGNKNEVKMNFNNEDSSEDLF